MGVFIFCILLRLFYGYPMIIKYQAASVELTAPDGLIENGKLRLWYHGVKAPLYFPWPVGYAEADYPLEW